ncbi:MAG TPA: hypothetical protein PKU83_12455, partial [Chryseolinea sp.]|nr:hypothetical protein [Chryseolinea sp.]
MASNLKQKSVLLVAKESFNNRFTDHYEISTTANSPRKKSQDSSLSLDELQRLARTPCRIPVLKQAFLFSCLTGIQWN